MALRAWASVSSFGQGRLLVRQGGAGEVLAGRSGWPGAIVLGPLGLGPAGGDLALQRGALRHHVGEVAPGLLAAP